jgi:hypothetical protein
VTDDRWAGDGGGTARNGHCCLISPPKSQSLVDSYRHYRHPKRSPQTGRRNSSVSERSKGRLRGRLSRNTGHHHAWQLKGPLVEDIEKLSERWDRVSTTRRASWSCRACSELCYRGKFSSDRFSSDRCASFPMCFTLDQNAPSFAGG